MAAARCVAAPLSGTQPRLALDSTLLALGGCIPHDREWALMLGIHAHEWDSQKPGTLFTKKGFRGEHHGSKVCGDIGRDIGYTRGDIRPKSSLQ